MKIKNYIELKDESENLSQIRLAVVGRWKGHPNGEFAIDIADIEKMKINFDKRKTDVVIDYEHQTLNAAQAPAAGWIKEVFIKDDELWGRVAWNKKAKEYIKNGEYKYLSPVFEFFAVDEKTGVTKGANLHSASLTNTPFLDELGEVVANKNKNLKDVKMDKELEELRLKNKSLEDELEAARTKNTELENSLVEEIVRSAIFANKLSSEQKTWALNYGKKDLNGLKEFLNTQKKVVTVELKNNLFENKADDKNDFDPVLFATKYKNN